MTIWVKGLETVQMAHAPTGIQGRIDPQRVLIVTRGNEMGWFFKTSCGIA
jgi:hypothetical protein